MSIHDKLKAQGMTPITRLYDGSKPMVFTQDCDFCNESFVTCTRFGQQHYMCILCEHKITDRLKLILDFE